MKIPSADYKLWRQNIQTGDILACMGNSKMSKGIQWTEDKQDKNPLCIIYDKKKCALRGYFTHVGVFVRVLDQIFIIEANGKKVAFTRFSGTYKGYDGHLFIIRKERVGFKEMKAFANACLEVEGAKYDWKAIWQQLVNCFKEEAIKHKDNKQLFCSELLNMASGYYWASKDEWCTPHDIVLKERENILVRITDVK